MLRAALLALAAAACSEEPRRLVVTEWFLVEQIRPPTIPDVVELGPWRQRAYVRAGAEAEVRWNRVHDGPLEAIAVLDGGSAVALQSALAVFHRGEAEAFALDPIACSRTAAASFTATPDGSRLVCTRVERSPGGCDTVRVTQLDSRGRRLRVDRLVDARPCRWRAKEGDPNSVWVFGMTSLRDPVVAVAARVPLRALVYVLEPGGPREIEQIERSLAGMVGGAFELRERLHLDPLVVWN